MPEIFEWLLDHGADIELREQDYGSPPLRAMHLARRGLAGDFEDVPPPEAYWEIIELLRELGVK